jgi:tetratricopeptide (TPR) repeat protein
LGMVLDECVPRPGCPPAVEAAIEACLQYRPERRPASVAEISRILSEPQAAAKNEVAPSRRQWLLKYAVPSAIFSLSGVSLLWVVNRLTTQEKIFAGSLLLNTVQNHTGDSRLNGLTYMLEAQLAQSAALRLVPASRVSELLQRMGQTRPEGALNPLQAREVALRNGASTAVVYSVLSRISSTLRLDVRIEQPGTRPDEVRASLDRRFEASGEQDLLQQIRAAAVWIRESSGEAEPEIRLHNQPPSEQTTSSWDALALFERARELRMQRKLTEAEAMLREALRLDPGFSTAMRELADLLVSMARLREGFAMWKAAVESGRSRMLNTRERFRLEAAYLDDIGDLESAESTLRLWIANYEQDYLPRFYLSNIRMRQYRPEEALTLMQEAVQRDPGAMPAVVFLAMHLMVLDRGDEALERLRQLEQSGEWIESRTAAARVLASMGRLEEAEAMARRAIDAAGGPGKGQAAAMVLANILVEAGRDDAAEAGLVSGADEDLKQGRVQSGASKLEAAAYLALRRGEHREAGQRAKRVLDLGDPYRELAAVVLARSGSSWTRDAVQLFRQWKQSMPEGLPRFERLKAHLEAEILLSQGKVREATAGARRLAQWDSAWFWSDCLPRCLEAAGLKQESDKEFSAIAGRKRYFWHVTPRVPGLLRDCVAKTRK